MPVSPPKLLDPPAGGRVYREPRGLPGTPLWTVSPQQFHTGVHRVCTTGGGTSRGPCTAGGGGGVVAGRGPVPGPRAEFSTVPRPAGRPRAGTLTSGAERRRR